MPDRDDWQTEKLDNWKYGVCDCMQAEPEVWLMACCCPAIRWAETLSMACLVGFWIAFAIFLACDVVGSVAGEVLLWILLAVICAGFRQEMRRKFNMKQQGG